MKQQKSILEYIQEARQQKNEAPTSNNERTLITKVSTIKELARRLTNDNLVPQLSLLKKYIDDTYNFAVKHFDESAQMNETSLRDLNLDLSNDTNDIVASANKIRQRFEYRTLQNQSYDEKQAEKIYLEVRKALKEAKKLIDACYNKIG